MMNLDTLEGAPSLRYASAIENRTRGRERLGVRAQIDIWVPFLGFLVGWYVCVIARWYKDFRIFESRLFAIPFLHSQLRDHSPPSPTVTVTPFVALERTVPIRSRDVYTSNGTYACT
jgi:hypothetical protein